MGDVTLVFFFSSRGRQTISDRDWSPDVCSPDLVGARLHDAFTARERPGGELPREQRHVRGNEQENEGRGSPHPPPEENGRASCRERVEIFVGAGSFKKKKNNVARTRALSVSGEV